jgi:hypothetical protein
MEDLRMVNVRLTFPPQDLASLFSECERKFYLDYSEFVSSELSGTDVQDFVHFIVEKEGNGLSEVEGIRVMRFPFEDSEAESEHADRKKIGFEGVAYFSQYTASTRRIDIYPPKFNPEHTRNMVAKQIWDEEEMRYYFFCYEPVKTLAHELLRIKYGANEDAIKKLSQKYMTYFERKTKGKAKYSNRPSFLLPHGKGWDQDFQKKKRSLQSGGCY